MKTATWAVTLRIIDTNGVYHWHTLKTIPDLAVDAEDPKHLHNVEFEKLIEDVKPLILERKNTFKEVDLKDFKLFYAHNILKSEGFDFYIDTVYLCHRA